MRSVILFLMFCLLFMLGGSMVSAAAAPPQTGIDVLSSSTTAAILLVDNDGDSDTYLPGATCVTGIPNDCSLRQAILVANATAGIDIIRFDLALYPGRMTIAPNSQLPEITRPVEIDGVTGTGGSCPTASNPANLPITLDGSNLSSGERGLRLGFYLDSNPFNSTSSDGSTIRGLNIINIPGSAIFIGETDDHTIVCNHIGLADGDTEAGNLIGINVQSAFYTADDNTIGGANIVDRNVISGNSTNGIYNDGTGTLVEGNYIGLDKTGALTRGNGENGIEDEGDNTIVRSNVVSGNAVTGIYVAADGTEILDNLVGTDATGTVARGNDVDGIEVNANGATIRDNIVADNGIYGIRLVGDNHIVQGNKIGTSTGGNAALGNVYSGIIALGNNVTIGGTSPGTDRNIIAANGGNGIWLLSNDSLIQGNHIGVGADGSTPLGNTGSGILLDGAVDNRVGQAGAENVIANNGLNGISVKDTGSTNSARNDLRDNFIDDNGALGIDLYGSGEAVGEVTPNDLNDSDTGPNGLQNNMTLTSAESSGRVQGVLHGPDGIYTISIYQLDTCDSSGYGEGGSNRIRLIPAATVTGGVYNYDEVLSPAPPLGSYLVTLVTDVNGNTSEFGNCQQVVEAAFVVDSVDDFADNNAGDGDCESVATNACTLRAVIEEVNALGGGPYTISFDFGSLNITRVIEPNSTLPTIVTPVIIDASTMTNASCPTGGSAADHRLILDGTNSVSGDGLRLATAASGSTIRGLHIRNFLDDGIRVDGDDNTIACNTLSNNFRGVNANGSDNRIGGTARSERNVIIDSNSSGVRLGDSATRNKVQGNYIGVAGDGTTAAGNGGSGVFLSGGGTNRIGGSVGFAANVIAANGNHGILLDPGAGNNQIWGNIIGLDAAGSTALGNNSSGIYVDSANSNEIGGDSDSKRNVIAANGANGIFLNSSSNVVQRNYIGTDVSGLVDLGNATMGIRVVDGDSNVIGGDNATDGNLIAGNDESGVFINGSAVATTIRNNEIGVNAGGNPLGNTRNGVHLTGQVSQAEVRNNTIAHNGKDGIAVFETVILSNFAGNEIYDNGELGIDLNNDDAVNPNDSGDGDSGANGLMNFPVILGADAGSNTVTIYLNSLAPRDYRIHVYRNRSCDSSGHGEGERYLGSFDVQAVAGNPNMQESAVLPRNFNGGDKITATATPLTSPITDGTSEFSACFTATGTATTQLTWGDQNVGFVINTASGMQPALDRIHEAWTQSAWAACPTCTPETMHLVPFKDSAIYLGGTDNPGQFGNWIDNLEAAGGGTCADATFAGLREFGINLSDESAPVSDAIVFSDSPPTGNRLAFGLLLDQLIERGIRVHNVGPTLCSNGNLPDYAMNYLALLSGGDFHTPASVNEYKTDAQMAMNLALSPDLIGSYMGHLDNSVDTFPIEVDSSITTLGVDYHIWCLTCTRSTAVPLIEAVTTAQNVTVELIDPDGNVIDGSTPGYQRLSTSTRDMQLLFETLNATDAGTWQLRVSGNGQYAINVFGNSDVHMTSIGQHSARANRPFQVRAFIAAEEGVQCHSSCTPVSATLKLVGLDNMNTIPVAMSNSGMPPSVYGGSVTVPTQGLYRLVAEGVLENGTHFMRVDPTPIRVRAHAVSGSGNASALPGSTRSISFELTNDGAPGRAAATTFDLELFSELGWTVTDSIPESVTLAAGESIVFTVDAVIPPDAEIGLIEESVFVAVPQNDLSASVSVSAKTSVIDLQSVFLPIVIK